MSLLLRQRLAELVFDIEVLLRQQNDWSETSPAEAVLSSTMPFCCDTLEAVAWLQFIFIPRITVLLNSGGELPQGSAIAPYFEEALKSRAVESAGLIELLGQVDKVLGVLCD